MSHERKPTTLQRIRRGFYCFLLSSFVWAQLIMIVFGLSFSFVENPIQALSPYKMEFAAPVAAVSSIFATILGGTLSPVLCAYSSSRMRWMLFFYSLAGAVLSVLLACSLGVSATMWLQQNATWKSSDFVPYVVPPVTLMAGTLGGFFGAMVMNRRLKKKNV